MSAEKSERAKGYMHTFCMQQADVVLQQSDNIAANGKAAN